MSAYKALFISILFLFSAGTINPLAAHAGAGTPNGGDACALEFMSYGRAIFRAIQSNAFFSKEVPLSELSRRVATASVQVTSESLQQNGIEVDALNDSEENLIRVNRRWCTRSTDSRWQIELVFHEYLGLTSPGIDKNYRISQRLFEVIGLTPSDLVSQSKNHQVITVSPLCNFQVEGTGVGALGQWGTNTGPGTEDRRWFAEVDCTSTTGELRVHKNYIYTALCRRLKPKSCIRNSEHYGSYQFASLQQCQSALRESQFSDAENPVGFQIDKATGRLEFFGVIPTAGKAACTQ